jgi:glucose-6-phosphate isomerase
MGIWNVNFLKIPSLAILPYSSRLSSFPRFMQQLEMESNGKSVSQFGDLLDYETAPIVWGTVGNDAQHSFFQLLHQGTLRASLDFILIKRSPIGDSESQLLANANALAQIEALAVGHSSVDPHRRHPGNRPCSVLVAESLSPKTLGALIAIYEHKIFVQSLIWGINAFDQYGVERGKAIFEKTRAALSAGNTSGLLTVKHLINRVA